MEGIIIFNKPLGKTSTEITNFFKKIIKKKVGHGGTLDRFAEGLLIIGIGNYTKELIKFLKESRKTYIAEIVFGAFSDTYDTEGKIIETGKPIPDFSEIEKVLKSFIGEIEQIPPLYSAIKIKGKRASDLIREGKSIELKPRKVIVYGIKILGTQTVADYTQTIADNMQILTDNTQTVADKTQTSADYTQTAADETQTTANRTQLDESILSLRPSASSPRKSAFFLTIEAEVSSGTYIRSLVHDLGQKLGCGAYVNKLIRTKIKVPKILPEVASKYDVRISSRESSPEFASKNNVRISSRESLQEFAPDYEEFNLEEALTFEDIEKDYLEFIAKVYGRVQGVGFRFFVEALANKLKIFGYAQNLPDGTVEVLAQGKEKDLQTLIENLKIGPKLAKVEKIDIIFRKPLRYFYEFKIF